MYYVLCITHIGIKMGEVGIATGYRLDGWYSIPGGDDIE
jgi:hypothetical protein